MAKTQNTLVEAIIKSIPIIGTFIISAGVAALITPDELVVVLAVGLILAFVSFIAVLISVVILEVLESELSFKSVLEASAGLISVFILSDALVALLPEEYRAFIVTFGMVLGWLAFLAILLTTVYLEYLKKHPQSQSQPH
ncbi:MAG: hypothetical protein ACFE95_15705 [Candidatus Hodarchaeota archaeon]